MSLVASLGFGLSVSGSGYALAIPLVSAAIWQLQTLAVKNTDIGGVISLHEPGNALARAGLSGPLPLE